jgi:hypothetical protein
MQGLGQIEESGSMSGAEHGRDDEINTSSRKPSKRQYRANIFSLMILDHHHGKQ